MSDRITRAWKGFDKDFRCRGHQFEVGGEYTHDGPVKVCASGFHACGEPLDVLAYYPAAEARYAEVELIGETQSHTNDSKLCAAKIRIVREISILDLWAAHREMVAGAAKEAQASGDGGHAQASGDRGIAASFGINATAAAGASGWLVLAEYDDANDLLLVRAAAVGTEGIEPGKTYRLSGGRFVPAHETAGTAA